MEFHASVVKKGEVRKLREVQREAGLAGTPENAGITNTRACCFIFSSVRGPEGNRGMWESYFLLCLANGTSSSFYASFVFL